MPWEIGKGDVSLGMCQLSTYFLSQQKHNNRIHVNKQARHMPMWTRLIKTRTPGTIHRTAPQSVYTHTLASLHICLQIDLLYRIIQGRVQG